MARTKQTARKLPCAKASCEQSTAKSSQHTSVTKPRRIHNEIRRYLKSTTMAIDKVEFLRLVRKIALDLKIDMRFQCEAIETLQEASEQFLIGVFEYSNIMQFSSLQMATQGPAGVAEIWNMPETRPN